ncbi:hypothetical protein F5X96DRAFT_670137 [Biscogniauxia mediterranea]|nr:hypothetical protein F5X96DRAFT_670137 [Biscogniauxia mediterranea]
MPAGLALLRATPFLASTSALTFTISEDLFIRSLKTEDPELRALINRVLPAHVKAWIPGAFSLIIGLYSLSISTAAANLGVRDIHVDISGASRNQHLAAGFYLAGLVFNLVHFVFGRHAVTRLFSLRSDKGVNGDRDRDNSASLKAWVHINAIRGIVADLPAWICYFVAFIVANR